MSGGVLADGNPTVERIEFGFARAAISPTLEGMSAAVSALSPTRDLALCSSGERAFGHPERRRDV